MKKRLMTLLLSAIMVVTMMPAMAFASVTQGSIATEGWSNTDDIRLWQDTKLTNSKVVVKPDEGFFWNETKENGLELTITDVVSEDSDYISVEKKDDNWEVSFLKETTATPVNLIITATDGTDTITAKAINNIADYLIVFNPDSKETLPGKPVDFTAEIQTMTASSHLYGEGDIVTEEFLNDGGTIVWNSEDLGISNVSGETLTVNSTATNMNNQIVATATKGDKTYTNFCWLDIKDSIYEFEDINGNPLPSDLGEIKDDGFEMSLVLKRHYMDDGVEKTDNQLPANMEVQREYIWNDTAAMDFDSSAFNAENNPACKFYISPDYGDVVLGNHGFTLAIRIQYFDPDPEVQNPTPDDYNICRSYVKKWTCKFKGVCAHKWNEGTITTQPTDTQDGLKTYKCLKCGETKTETIAALGAVNTAVDDVVNNLPASPTDTEKTSIISSFQSINSTKTNAISYSLSDGANGKMAQNMAAIEAKVGAASVSNSSNVAGVSIIGGGLNAKSDGGAVQPVTLNIGASQNSTDAKAAVPSTIDTDNAVVLSMTLDGADTDKDGYLKVPVLISFAVPTGIDADKMVVVHESQNKDVELLKPILSADKKTASIVVTHFSDFVIAETKTEQGNPEGGNNTTIVYDEGKWYWAEYYGDSYNANSCELIETGTELKDALSGEGLTVSINSNAAAAFNDMKTAFGADQEVYIEQLFLNTSPGKSGFVIPNTFSFNYIRMQYDPGDSSVQYEYTVPEDDFLAYFITKGGNATIHGHVIHLSLTGDTSKEELHGSTLGNIVLDGDADDIEWYRYTATTSDLTDAYTGEKYQECVDQSKEQGYFNGNFSINASNDNEHRLGYYYEDEESGDKEESFFSVIEPFCDTIEGTKTWLDIVKAKASQTDFATNTSIITSGKLKAQGLSSDEYEVGVLNEEAFNGDLTKYSTDQWYNSYKNNQSYRFYLNYEPELLKEDNTEYTLFKVVKVDDRELTHIEQRIQKGELATALNLIPWNKVDDFDVYGTSPSGITLPSGAKNADRIFVGGGKVTIPFDVERLDVQDLTKWWGGDLLDVSVDGDVKNLSLLSRTQATNVTITGKIENGDTNTSYNTTNGRWNWALFDKKAGENNSVIDSGTLNKNIMLNAGNVSYSVLTDLDDIEEAVGITSSDSNIQATTGAAAIDEDALSSVMASVTDFIEEEATLDGWTASDNIASITVNKVEVGKGGNVTGAEDIIETTSPIEYTIYLGDEYDENTEYGIVRIHDDGEGETTFEKIDSEVDENGCITFESKLFSDFAVITKENAGGGDNPGGGDTPGGSGGGGGAPAEDDKTKVDPGKSDGTVTATVGEDTKVEKKAGATGASAQTTISAETTEQIVKAAQENKSKEIAIDAKADTKENVTTSEVSVPIAIVDAAKANEATIKIETNTGAMSMDADTAKQLCQAGAESVKFTIEKSDASTDKQTVYEITLETIKNGVATEVTKLGGKIEISVDVPAGYDDKKPVVLCINGKNVEVVASRVEGGKLIMTLEHLSTYAIMSEADADEAIKASAEATTMGALSLKAYANGKIKATWKNGVGNTDSIVKYQVYRAKDKKFTKNLKKYTSTGKSYTMTKSLKKGTKYYVKVRAQIKINDKTYYSKWSDVKSIKCKRTR